MAVFSSLMFVGNLPGEGNGTTPSTPPSHGLATHVVVLVWDGMRPDLVSKEFTPHLFELAKNGTVFAHNHPVYLSSTEVNGTAIATGMYPEHSGVIGNKEYRPEIDPSGPIGMESLPAIRKGDTLPGRYLHVPTLAELLQQQGFQTAIAGTKPVALLHDRAAREAGASHGQVLFAGKSLPESLLNEVVAGQGAFPSPITFPNVGQVGWTTKALTEQLWKKGCRNFHCFGSATPIFPSITPLRARPVRGRP